MGFRMPSNKRIHPQNSKVVNTAIDTIKTTSKIAQEKYWNAFQVNGYNCIVYSKLEGGRKCSCSELRKREQDETLLDENGNASREFISGLLSGGQTVGIEKYGSHRSEKTNSTRIRELDTNSTNNDLTTQGTDLTDIDSHFIEENYTEDMLENDIDVHTNKCNVCNGSSYVGGYVPVFGQRYVLDTTYEKKKLFGYSVRQENTPHTFTSTDYHNSYVDFTIALPKDANQVTAFQVWANTEKVDAEISFSTDGETFQPQTQILSFCTGEPITIRISGTDNFTHLELQFNLSNTVPLLEYPHLTRTGDLSVLNAVGDIQILLSPMIPDIKPWDVIVDNTHGKYWLVKEITDHKDRNMNMHGWEVQARLIQPYELNFYLPMDKTNQRPKSTNFNRY